MLHIIEQIKLFSKGGQVTDRVTKDNYHISTKGIWSSISSEEGRELLYAYLEWRKKRVKPETIEVNGNLYYVDYESIKKNAFFRSRSFSIYLIPKGGRGVIRISDHWSKSNFARSKKFNVGFIRSCYWELPKNAESFAVRLPSEKYQSVLVAAKISFNKLQKI